MKIRNGFVSNSSSSSFVILGISKSREELLKLFGWNEDSPNLDLDGDEYDEVSFIEEKVGDLDFYLDEGVVGYVIAEGDEVDFGGKELTLPELTKLAEDVSKKLNVPIEDIKLYSGIRNC